MALSILAVVIALCTAVNSPEGNAPGESIIQCADTTHEMPPGTAYNFTDEEIDLLLHIGAHEALNQGKTGIALVMRCVLNRVEDPRFPDNIHDVIYAPGQFSGVQYIFNKPLNDDCYIALQMIQEGWDESQGCLYFNSCGVKQGTEYLYTYKAHSFYR